MKLKRFDFSLSKLRSFVLSSLLLVGCDADIPHIPVDTDSTTGTTTSAVNSGAVSGTDSTSPPAGESVTGGSSGSGPSTTGTGSSTAGSGSSTADTGSSTATGSTATNANGGTASTSTSTVNVPHIMSLRMVTDDSMIMSWSINANNRIKSYRVYKNEQFYYSPTQRVVSDAGLNAGTQYCYRVSAIDYELTESALSLPACITPGSDATDFLQQMAIWSAARIIDKQTLALSWRVNTEKSNKGYRLYRDGQLLTSTADNHYTDENLTSGTVYCYTITVVGNDDRESPHNTQLCETPRIVWQTRLQVPAVAIKNLIDAGSYWLAVGDAHTQTGNAQFTSADGIDWQTHTDVDFAPLDIIDAVAFQDRIISVTGSGWFYTSINGSQWQSFPNVSAAFFNATAMTSSEDMLVVVGEDGNIFSSADGDVWTDRSLDDVDHHLYDVQWLNEQFIATGDNGTVLLSDDAIEWQHYSVPYDTASIANGRLSSVSWTGSQYVAIALNHAYTSSDGSQWDSHHVPRFYFIDAAWSEPLNLLVGISVNGAIATSADGSSWTTQVDIDTLGSLQTIVWDGRQFIAAGDSSLIITSADGIHWTTRQYSFKLNSVAWISDAFYAVGGSGHLLKSADGLSWQYLQTGSNADFFHDIASNTERFVTPGQTYLSSADSNLNWDVRHWMGATTHAMSVIWDGARFATVGSNGVVRTSSDGVTFEHVFTSANGSHTTLLQDIIYNGSQYTIVGYNGTVLTSRDLISFEQQATPGGDNLRAIARNTERYVTVGENGVILTSTNSTDWHQLAAPTENNLRDIVWAEDQFVAVGWQVILQSRDGIDWQAMPSYPAYPLYHGDLNGIAFNGQRYVAVGQQSRIVTFERQ